MMRTLSKLGAAATLAVMALTAHAEPLTPSEIIKTSTTEVRQDIADNVETYQNDKDALYAMVEQKIVPIFDTTYVGKVILGRHLKDATDEQVQQFETAFKDMLIHTYADKLLEYYDSVDIDVKPARIDGKRANVDITLERNNGKPPIPMTFSMRQTDGNWKIWDIKAENLSLVLNYRTQMDSEIKRAGIEDVIKRLNEGQLIAEAKSPDAEADKTDTP
ncbi:MAG: ABC transporter substrate-binding protein [Nevskiales bacterium]|nr:ABC transporter substrate-binding protein [Nevskiales bacterium]